MDIDRYAQLIHTIIRNVRQTLLATFKAKHISGITHQLVNFSPRKKKSTQGIKFTSAEITVSRTRLFAFCCSLTSQHAQTPSWAPVTRAVPPELTQTGQGKRGLQRVNRGAGIPGVARRLGVLGQIGTLCHLVNTSLLCGPATECPPAPGESHPLQCLASPTRSLVCSTT